MCVPAAINGCWVDPDVDAAAVFEMVLPAFDVPVPAAVAAACEDEVTATFARTISRSMECSSCNSWVRKSSTEVFSSLILDFLPSQASSDAHR